jgi:hypothetical protein
MSLIVATFHRDPLTQAIIDDPYPEEAGRDLAGLESWRHKVWGSTVVINLGAKFLPQLASSDLYVENEHLAAFEDECKALLNSVGVFAAQVECDPTSITARLENFLWAIAKARATSGGVYIG